MKNKEANLYSMVLRPHAQDTYLRTVNPTFSLPHDTQSVPQPSSSHKALKEVYKTIEIKPSDRKAKLIAAILASEAGKANDFEGLQRELTKIVKERFRETIDFTLKSKADIEQSMGLNETSPALEYIESLLGYCAPHLFEKNDNQSPFNAIDSGTTNETKQAAREQLSILTQFLLAEINIYSVANQKTTSNFGKVLEQADTVNIGITLLRMLTRYFG